MTIRERIARMLRLERRDFLTDPPLWFRTSLSGSPASSGVVVNAETALGATPVWAAIRVISEDIASLPLITYNRLERGKERATRNPLFALLHDQPNPELTAFEFWELAVGNILLNGNSVNFIETDNGGRPVELWPIRPDQVTLMRDDRGGLVYHWQPAFGDPRDFPADEILHIRGFSSRFGLWGLSPIDVAREAIGLSLATQEYGARFFGQDATPGGVLEHPKLLTEDARKNLRDSWEANHAPLSRKHRIAILEEGMKWTQTTISPENAQFLETRKFSVGEVARIFRVAPHKIGDLERATFSNIEEQNIDHVISTIRPWAKRIEQRVNVRLFPKGGKLFAEFLLDGLLRGNQAARFTAYATARQWGWFSVDDIRELENLNPLPDGLGAEYLVPLNMAGAGEAPPPPAIPGFRSLPPAPRVIEARLLEELPAESQAATRSRRALCRAFLPVFEDAASRVLRRERRDVEQKATEMLEAGGVEAFTAWLTDFYANDHQSFVSQQIAPAVRSLTEAMHERATDEVASTTGSERQFTPDQIDEIVAAMAFSISTRWVTWSNAQLTHVLGAAEGIPLQDVITRLVEWGEKRAGKFAMRETVNVGSSVARSTWKSSGVTSLRWVASGPCPMCASLDGMIVSIQGSFAEPGEEITGDDGTTKIRHQGIIRHPPLHNGCECTVAPA